MGSAAQGLQCGVGSHHPPHPHVRPQICRRCGAGRAHLAWQEAAVWVLRPTPQHPQGNGACRVPSERRRQHPPPSLPPSQHMPCKQPACSAGGGHHHRSAPTPPPPGPLPCPVPPPPHTHWPARAACCSLSELVFARPGRPGCGCGCRPPAGGAASPSPAAAPAACGAAFARAVVTRLSIATSASSPWVGSRV